MPVRHLLPDPPLKRLDHDARDLVLHGAHHGGMQRVLESEPDLQLHSCLLVLLPFFINGDQLPPRTEVVEQPFIGTRHRLPILRHSAPAPRLNDPSVPVAVHARRERLAEGPVPDRQERLRRIPRRRISRRHRRRRQEGQEIRVGLDGGDDVEERRGRERQRAGCAEDAAVVGVAVAVVAVGIRGGRGGREEGG